MRTTKEIADLNAGGRAKLLLMVGLALLTGLSVISLPEVLTVSRNASPQGLKTNTNSTDGITTFATGSTTARAPANTTRTQPAPMGTELTISSLSILVSIILVLPLTLAFFTSTLAARRSRTKFKHSLEA